MRAALDRLRAAHAGAAPVTVFYQVWRQPLMTINGKHLIDDILTLCGGRNVFAGLTPLVPTISTEVGRRRRSGSDPDRQRDRQPGAVAARSGATRASPPGIATAAMTAVRRSWLYALNGDNISRQGPRVVDGAAAVCAVLDQVRAERAAR